MNHKEKRVALLFPDVTILPEEVEWVKFRVDTNGNGAL